MQNAHFTPPQLAPMFRVNVSTIKRWVNKGYLDAEVTAGGHRRITKKQLEKFIKKYPPYAKSSYVLRRLQKKDYCPSRNCWGKYYNYLLRNENQKAGQIIEKLFLSGTSIIELLRIVVTPTMRHISDLWTQKKITIYEEHRMSFNIRMHLIKLDQFISDTTKKDSPTAILACAPGEFHEMPLQLIALLFKLNSWKTYILGVNISISELIKAAKKIKPQVVVVSKTYTKKESPNFFKKLGLFMDKNDICMATGGGAWKKEVNSQFMSDRRCAKYFPALKLFSDFLQNYKRK